MKSNEYKVPSSTNLWVEGRVMPMRRALYPGTVGTTLMTVFSYLVTVSKNRNFKEPVLLAELIRRMLTKRNISMFVPLGWGMHYIMGYLLTLAFQKVWSARDIKPSAKDVMCSGLISGTGGVLIWKGLFKLHPYPPSISFKRFYGHLLLAHIVFSLGVVLAHRQQNMNRSL